MKTQSLLLLKRLIQEHLKNESVVKTDDDGDVVIRKLVKFKKNNTRFHIEDTVDADIDPESFTLDVNNVETWVPDINTNK